MSPDPAELRVAERRGDVEAAHLAALDGPALQARHLGRAALIEERIGPLRVLDFEDDPAHVFGMLGQPAEALAFGAARREEDEADRACLDDAGTRVVLRLEAGRGDGHLGEVELLPVVVAAALEIAHEDVQRGDLLDAERFPGRVHRCFSAEFDG